MSPRRPPHHFAAVDGSGAAAQHVHALKRRAESPPTSSLHHPTHVRLSGAHRPSAFASSAGFCDHGEKARGILAHIVTGHLLGACRASSLCSRDCRCAISCGRPRRTCSSRIRNATRLRPEHRTQDEYSRALSQFLRLRRDQRDAAFRTLVNLRARGHGIDRPKVRRNVVGTSSASAMSPAASPVSPRRPSS